MSFVTTQPEVLTAAAGRLAGHRFCDGRRECGRGGADHRGSSRGRRRGVGADRGAVRRARRACTRRSVPKPQRFTRCL